MNLRVTAVIVFLIYIVGLYVLGIIGLKRTKGFEDFASARRAYGPVTTALVAVATAASAITFMGVPGFCYKFGFPMWWFALAWPSGIAITFSLVARRITNIQTNTGAISIPDYVGERFNSDALRVIAAITTLMLFWWVLGNFVGFGWLFSTLFDVDYKTGVILGTIFTVGYILIGGSHSGVLTNCVQAIIMIFVSHIIATMVLMPGLLFDGGVFELNALLAKIDPSLTAANFFSKHPMVDGPFSFITLIISMMLIAVTTGHAKYLISLKDINDFGKFNYYYLIFGWIMGLAALGGLAARVLFESNIPPDQALPLFILNAFSPIVECFCALRLCRL
jgi:Na+/proline symporter